jgi:O-antigen ligase
VGEKLKIGWVYGLTSLFLLVNLYLVVQKDMYWLFVLPVALIVMYYYLTAYDKILLFITFLTPLAVNINDLEMGMGVSLPTEPLMFGVLLIFIINVIYQNNYDKRISSHTISYIIYLNLFWILLTSFTSEMPIVSIKFFISRLWFVVPFFFVAAMFFRKMENIKRFFWLYLAGLVIVIIYTTTVHAKYGFDEETGHWVMSPFYNDHTAYGAALAMFFPVCIGLIFFPGIKNLARITASFTLLFLVTAIILSYSRAAWLSILASSALFLLIVFRIRVYWVISFLIVVIGLFFAFQHQIIDKLEKNKQDSSANFAEHIKSITNISSDASNLERINRWQAAVRLYDERPVFGWGPGTYQFVYAPYQRSKEKTIISTNLGDKGNAHSEYLGPLAEEGMPGMLIVILLFASILYSGIKVYEKGNLKVKFLSMMATIGLATYMAHGVLNNFLNTDKLSVPFWGFTAVIVALDIYHTQNPTEVDQPNREIPS